MTDKNPEGIIWAKGIHHVYLGGKPTRVSAPQEGVFNTYRAMQREISENGGLPLGIDHLPESVLNENPILAELLKESDIDPYNVGMIEAIAMEGDQIEIRKSRITNPQVQKLYNDGKLPAYSLVGKPIINPCTTGKADVIASDFSKIKRVDFVPKGGCEKCKTNSGILTAKLSSEENTMTKKYENSNLDKDGKIIDPSKDKNGNSLKDKDGKLFKLDKDGVVEFKDDKPVLVEDKPNPTPAKTDMEKMQEMQEKQTESINTLNKTVQNIVSGEIKIEAKLPEDVQEKLDKVDDLVMEAKTSKVETKINKKIMDGTVTPAMKEGLLEAGNVMEPEKFDNMLKGYKKQLWEGGRLSEIDLEAGDPGPDELDMSKFKESRQSNKF